MTQARYQKPLSDEIAQGFDTTRALLSELFACDRQDAAQLAVLTTRLEMVTRDMDRLAHLGQEVLELRLTVQALQKRADSGPPREVLVESTRGKWAAIGLAITAASGAVMGVINLLK
jgi:hypothetical protein